MKNLFFLILLFSFVNLSCKKNSGDSPLYPSGKKVVIAGYDLTPDRSNAVIWLNGEELVLEGEGQATCITASGADFYVGGEGFVAGGHNAIYWLNGGAQVNFSGALSGNSAADVRGIAVAGSDIYLSGDFSDYTPGVSSTFSPAFWKNGTLNHLAGYQNGTAYNIAVQGGQVFVPGFYQDSENINHGVIWTNGVAIPFPGDQSTYVAVSGKDIYSIGQTTNMPARFFKNGVEITLPQLGGASSITINDDDVYVSGSTGDFRPAIWKNGELNVLDNRPGAGTVTQVAIDGKDVYAVGYNYGDSALLWKNGRESVLKRSGTAAAYGIVIVP